MSVVLDLTTGSYLLFRLMPFLVATVLSLAPLLVFSWKGVPYLCLLLATLALSSVLGPAAEAVLRKVFPFLNYGGGFRSAAHINAVCSAFVLGSGAQPYSVAAPLDVTLLAFSGAYLLYFIVRNGLGEVYRSLQAFFLLIAIAYTVFLRYNECTTMVSIFIALALGSCGGYLGGAFVAKHFPSLMYLAAPSSRQSCARIDDETYTCRGGDRNTNAD